MRPTLPSNTSLPTFFCCGMGGADGAGCAEVSVGGLAGGMGTARQQVAEEQ